MSGGLARTNRELIVINCPTPPTRSRPRFDLKLNKKFSATSVDHHWSSVVKYPWRYKITTDKSDNFLV